MQNLERLDPLVMPPVIVGQHDAMARITNLIHEGQGRSTEPSVKQLIFENNRLASDAIGLA